MNMNANLILFISIQVGGRISTYVQMVIMAIFDINLVWLDIIVNRSYNFSKYIR